MTHDETVAAVRAVLPDMNPGDHVEVLILDDGTVQVRQLRVL